MTSPTQPGARRLSSKRRRVAHVCIAIVRTYNGAVQPMECSDFAVVIAGARTTHLPVPRWRGCTSASWLSFLQCVLESRTVRDSARVIGVHCNTNFRWRHRFVAAAARDRPAVLSGMVEVDETYRLESQKGARNLSRPARRRGGIASRCGIIGEHDCQLVARDSAGQTLDFHMAGKPVSVWQLRGCLRTAMNSNVLLIAMPQCIPLFAEDAPHDLRRSDETSSISIPIDLYAQLGATL